MIISQENKNSEKLKIGILAQGDNIMQKTFWGFLGTYFGFIPWSFSSPTFSCSSGTSPHLKTFFSPCQLKRKKAYLLVVMSPSPSALAASRGSWLPSAVPRHRPVEEEQASECSERGRFMALHRKLRAAAQMGKLILALDSSRR